MLNEKDDIRILAPNEPLPYELLLLADESLQAVEKYINDCEIFVIESRGIIIAEYALLPINSESVEIKNIAVLPEFQSKGIGRKLISDAVERARTKGFKQLLLGTGDASFRPLEIYMRAGFEVFYIKQNFFYGNYLNRSMRTASD